MKKPKKIPKGFVWDPVHKELIDIRCNNPKLKKLAKNSVQIEKSIHVHAAWFGSELACKECNPVCYRNHQMENPNHLKWCEEDGCPLNPIPLTPELRKKILEKKSNRNPALEKLFSEPVLLTTPFYSIPRKDLDYSAKVFSEKLLGKSKKSRKKEVPWEHYSHIALLTSCAKLRRMLLGRQLYWTIKEDGENVTIWLKKKKYVKGGSSLYTGLVDIPKGFEAMVSSHNQEIASADITSRTQGCPEYQLILQMIKDNPTYRVIAEECKKGLSVTRIKTYPEATLIVVDIYDTAIMNFLPYSLVYQTCFHYKVPVVKLFSITRHKTMKDLLKYKNHVLEVCESIKEEGMVVKTFTKDGEYIQSKVKIDTPEPKERKVREGQIQLPQIPENEIMGAISHVEADFGLDGTPKHDMPLIAKAVAEECRKHLYSNRGNLFSFYQEYMETRK